MWLALAKHITDDIMWATYKQKLEDTLAVSGSSIVLSLYHNKCRKNVYSGAEVYTENIKDVTSMCISECEDVWSTAVLPNCDESKKQMFVLVN